MVGVGPGNGSSIARRLAARGYPTALMARDPGRLAPLADELGGHAISCDAGDPASVARAFARARELGDPEVLVFNAGSGVWGSVEDVDAAGFESSWRVNALGLLLASQEVIPAMKRGGGSIIVIGATASRRGGAGAAAFAAGKAAQRSLAESMARHLWPQGIHVALVVIDGVVDMPRTRERMPDRPASFFVDPDAVAATVAHLVEQDRSAWSFEVEARPFGEHW